MIARVQYKGKAYYSYVFARFEVFYMNYYIVYDSIDNKFDMVALFSKKWDGTRQIGLINEHEFDFVKAEDVDINIGLANKIKGYPWLVSNSENLKKIADGKDMPEEFINKALEMNKTIDPDKFNEVTNDEEAMDMMEHTGGFHDQYWVEMRAISDDVDCFTPAKLQIRFTSQGPFDVLVEFEDGLYINIGFYSANRIFTSTIVVGEKFIYWVNDAEDGLSEKEVKNYRFIQCKKLRWKFILKEENDW